MSSCLATTSSLGTEVISPGEGGSDDNSDRPTVLQSNPPLSGKALMYQQYLESKKNDTTMNVPGDNVVTAVIFQEGVDLMTKVMDLQYYHLILH